MFKNDEVVMKQVIVLLVALFLVLLVVLCYLSNIWIGVLLTTVTAVVIASVVLYVSYLEC